MPGDLRIARIFCLVGAVLLLAGLFLWWRLPIAIPLPPYLFTSLLALAYGFFCWRKGRRASAGKKEPSE